MACREIRTLETCDGCGFQNHIVVCYGVEDSSNQPEVEFCLGCGDTIKAATCLAMFVASSSASLNAKLAAFKSGRLCSSLKPPAGVL